MKTMETMTDLTSKDFIVRMVEESTGAPPPPPVPPYYRDPNRESLWKFITVINLVATIILIIFMSIFH